jgi:hypothetical protein
LSSAASYTGKEKEKEKRKSENWKQLKTEDLGEDGRSSSR